MGGGGINKRRLRLQRRSKVKISPSAWMSLCLAEGGKKAGGAGKGGLCGEWAKISFVAAAG